MKNFFLLFLSGLCFAVLVELKLWQHYVADKMVATLYCRQNGGNTILQTKWWQHYIADKTALISSSCINSEKSRQKAT